MILSIVTITFNNISELKRTLNSIPKSDFVELIVINGGECAETKEYLNSFSGKSISEPDKGIADAFNKGLKLSTGYLIMFLNSGDIISDPDYLREAVGIFLSNKDVDFVHSNLILDYHQGSELFMKPTFSSLGRGMPYLHPTMIVRKTVFDKLGEFNLNYKISMDFDFVVRLNKAKLKGYYVKDKFSIRMAGSGKSIVNEGKAIHECYKILKENNVLNLKNYIGFIVRCFLFISRKFLESSGNEKLLLKLKRKKYSQ